MGVKTEITLLDLKGIVEAKTFEKTYNGFRDSVYILDKKYVLKIFENADEKMLLEEKKLLSFCSSLPVVKIVKDNFQVKNKQALLYEYKLGESREVVTVKDLKKVAIFLKDFHQRTRGKTSKNLNFFNKEFLKTKVYKSGKKEFITLFESIDIELNDDGIIHGDLFKDNVLFFQDEISGVLDFAHACNGDFFLDLAVIALDWCKNSLEVETLLKVYKAEVSQKEFNEYLKYAALFYALLRFEDNRNYQQLLKKLEKILFDKCYQN